MKKILLTVAAVTGMSLVAHSQGVISFQNEAGINGLVDLQSTANGSLSWATSFTVALYYADVSGAATTTSLGANQYGYLTTSQFASAVTSDGLTLGGTTTEDSSGSGGAGFFNGGALTLNVAGGVSDDIVLAAWTGGYATLALAEAANAEIGIIAFQNALGVGGTTPGTPYLTGWNGLTATPAVQTFEGGPGYPDLVMSPTVVPEPGTMALAGLGSLSLFLLRRKK